MQEGPATREAFRKRTPDHDGADHQVTVTSFEQVVVSASHTL
jgi:hypothetical protein